MMPAELRLAIAEWFVHRYAIALSRDWPRASPRAQQILDAADPDAVGDLANAIVKTIGEAQVGVATAVFALSIALSLGCKTFEKLPPDLQEEMRDAVAEIARLAIATYPRP